MKTMKRFAMLLLAALLLAGMVLPMGAAATGKVTYKGQANMTTVFPWRQRLAKQNQTSGPHGPLIICGGISG